MKEEGLSGLEYWNATGRHGFGGIACGGRLNCPLVAKVNGLALGGGFEIVLGCDIVIAARSASFGFPEPRVGRIPLDGMIVLPRKDPPDPRGRDADDWQKGVSGRGVGLGPGQ